MIYVTSDWHLTRENRTSAGLLQKLQLGDLVICLGDMANDWSLENGRFWFLHELEQYAPQILLIDGNHEDFRALNQLPLTYWNGIRVHRMGRGIYHALRGQILHIDGRKIWLMGGGFSGNGYIRRHPDIWQKEEAPTLEECRNGTAALAGAGWKADFMLTHTAPLQLIQERDLTDETDSFNRYLDEIAERTDFRRWYFGHFHRNQSYGNQYECIYQELRRLD
ncbi:MAG: metallophosphoesterase [Lachnospiraceae bacterium]|nr:metallophosphoesterase [Lachnospiraceae bacterium]